MFRRPAGTRWASTSLDACGRRGARIRGSRPDGRTTDAHSLLTGRSTAPTAASPRHVPIASRPAPGAALMLAMWAPADMFTGPVNMVTMSLKRGVTYFYEQPLMLVLVLVLVAGVIAVLETVNG